jgi:hypothetical protein
MLPVGAGALTLEKLFLWRARILTPNQRNYLNSTDAHFQTGSLYMRAKTAVGATEMSGPIPLRYPFPLYYSTLIVLSQSR